MSKIKKLIKRIIKGNPKPVFARITCSNPNELLKGRKVVITGGGRGLGCAMAKKFFSEGADVLITGRKEDKLKKSSEAIGCKYMVYDVTDFDNCETFIEKADELLNGLDTLVNNSGVSLHEPTFFDVTPESFDAQIVATNFKGPLFLSQKFITLHKKKGKTGTILFTSSETGETVESRPYGYTKAAINSLVKGLANLFVKEGIRINAVAPGITTSDITGFKADGNLSCPSNTLGRVYLPEEVAEVACF